MKTVIIVSTFILFALSQSVMAQGIGDVQDITRLKEIRVPFQPVTSLIAEADQQYVPDAIVVEFKREANVQPVLQEGIITTGIAAVDMVNKEFQVTKMYREFPDVETAAEVRRVDAPDLSRYYIVKFDSGKSLDDVVKAYSENPSVDHVEKIGVHRVFESIPNDPYFLSDQWNFYDSDDNDVDATDAWDLETGDASILLGDLDTGLQYNSRDLGGLSPYTEGNVWINWAEYNGIKGVDDDGNSYVDDWIGWDFVNGGSNCWPGEDCYTEDNEPTDFNGHGTHVGGIMGAITNNSVMVAGLAGGWNAGMNDPANGVKVMALRIGWSGNYGGQEVGYVRMDFAAQAMYYAANKGATAVNCSWGSSNTGGLGAALDYAIANGVLVVAAAGNDGDSVPDYLGQRTDVLNVCAVNNSDVKPWWSDYGTWVDVAAPGVNVISTYSLHYNPNYVAWVSGTSQASPHATGEAGILKSYDPTLTRQEIFDLIVDYTDNIDDLNPGYEGLLGSGRINVFKALDAVVAPSVTVIQPNGGEVLYIGQVYTIMWDGSDNVGIDTTIVEYSVDGGQNWWVIAELSGNPGSYDWTVTGPPSDQCRVQVTCCDAVGMCGSDMSDEDFCPPYKRVARNFSIASKDALVPREFGLAQNYPNPFNPTTRIAFDLPKDCEVDLSVYNVLGQKVVTLIGRELVAGHHEITWNAESVPSGVYFSTIKAGEFTATKRMVLMK
ncbi:MAG: S8 family serine peptidase [Gemmatimonadota bacterium]|nr:MAG: S8 family serine peptidase [Gemmatimonadota bacterium]